MIGQYLPNTNDNVYFVKKFRIKQDIYIKKIRIPPNALIIFYSFIAALEL